MGDYAELGDIVIDYGPVPADKQAKVERDIARAEAQLRLADPHIDQRVEDGSLPEVLVKQVICEMVLAVLHNPVGARSNTQTVGPFSQSQTFGDGTTGQLQVTDRQRDLLGLPSASRAFTITPGPRDGCWPTHRHHRFR